MNIFILNNNSQALRMTSDFLKNEGHSVIECTSIVEANYQYSTNKNYIDLIITGLCIPYHGLTEDERKETEGNMLTGWVWLKYYVLQENKNIGIIVFSMYADRLKEILSSSNSIYLNNFFFCSKKEVEVITDLKNTIKRITFEKKSTLEESSITVIVPNSSELSPKLIKDSIFVTKNSLSRIIENPMLMHDLEFWEFEELIAEIYKNLGYNVELTKRTKDGGKDIYIAHQDYIGSFLYLVECKKYAPTRPVSVGIIRNMYGVLEMQKANAGIICTTSRFSKDALNEIELNNLQKRIHTKDFDDIKELLKHIN